MTRTQIQLPEPLFHRMKEIAEKRDLSMAELVRRGMETYVQTCPEIVQTGTPWTMPVLRGSGGHLIDPALIHMEASVIEQRNKRH